MTRYHTARALGALAAFCMLSAIPLSAQPFEGAITMRVSGIGSGGRGPEASGPQEMEYLVRGGKMRTNLKGPMGSVAIIGVPAEKKLYMLIDQQSMYMEISTDEARAKVSGAMSDMPVPKITRTGKKETIAGYECEHILVETPQQSSDMCVARGLGPFMNALSAMSGMGRGAGAAPAWQRALTADGAFPLKVSRMDGTTQLEVTKIERRVLTDAQFTVPGSYTKMEMPRRP